MRRMMMGGNIRARLRSTTSATTRARRWAVNVDPEARRRSGGAATSRWMRLREPGACHADLPPEGKGTLEVQCDAFRGLKCLHDATPRGCYVGRPGYDANWNQWTQFAFDTNDRGRPGKPRTRAGGRRQRARRAPGDGAVPRGHCTRGWPGRLIFVLRSTARRADLCVRGALRHSGTIGCSPSSPHNSSRRTASPCLRRPRGIRTAMSWSRRSTVSGHSSCSTALAPRFGAVRVSRVPRHPPAATAADPRCAPGP
jgi:hypothetical protein